MKYCTAEQGRCFVIRLEDGDVIHEALETFAELQKIAAAALIVVGGADHGSRLVVGPQNGRSDPVIPVEHTLFGVHEVAGTGTIFPDEAGAPKLHMHIACGRHRETVTGCVRRGVKTWHVLEIVLFELTSTKAKRRRDAQTGFDLLAPVQEDTPS